MKLKNAIDYVPGQRNFKVLVDNPLHGTSIIMAFDSNITLPEHSTNGNVMIQVLEGSLEFLNDGNSETLTEGDFVILPPERKHAVTAKERCKVLVTKINA